MTTAQESMAYYTQRHLVTSVCVCVCIQRTPVNLIGLVQEQKYHNKRAIRLSSYYFFIDD